MIWKAAARYNQKSREINGHTTVVLRRKSGDVKGLERKFKLLGVSKND